MKVTVLPIVADALELFPKTSNIDWVTKDQQKNQDHSDHSTIKIIFNTYMCPVNL